MTSECRIVRLYLALFRKRAPKNLRTVQNRLKRVHNTYV